MNFSEIHIGQKAEIQHTITQKDIEKFVDLTGDDNRLHVDNEFAKNTSFKKPVAHGMLGASFISTIIGTKLPGDGALWFSQNIEFLLPVRIGDIITVEAEVIKILKRQNIIELRTDVFNQHRQKVIAGTAKVKIVEHKIPEKEVEKQRKQKTALIIGASGGIGSATAKKLAQKGYNLALHYFSNKSKVDEIKKEVEKNGVRAFVFHADITKLENVIELIENVNRAFDYLSALIIAATSAVPNIIFDKLEWEDIQNHIDINIKSAFYLAKGLKEKFIKQEFGRIVILTSQYTESTPPDNMLHYVTAKSALNGFAKSLATELASKKITVNLVSPSMTDTELIADVPEKNKLILAAQTPLKRLATPEDVADTIAFLVSDEAGFLTGQTIRVNGGINML
ncbi:MAG: SDR family oxidoreductase [Chlorobi bacterium]|nr:SDR family oxidoreductase [Chlorobiota bacterium]